MSTVSVFAGSLFAGSLFYVSLRSLNYKKNHDLHLLFETTSLLLELYDNKTNHRKEKVYETLDKLSLMITEWSKLETKDGTEKMKDIAKVMMTSGVSLEEEHISAMCCIPWKDGELGAIGDDIIKKYYAKTEAETDSEEETVLVNVE